MSNSVLGTSSVRRERYLIDPLMQFTPAGTEVQLELHAQVVAPAGRQWARWFRYVQVPRHSPLSLLLDHKAVVVHIRIGAGSAVEFPRDVVPLAGRELL